MHNKSDECDTLLLAILSEKNVFFQLNTRLQDTPTNSIMIFTSLVTSCSSKQTIKITSSPRIDHNRISKYRHVTKGFLKNRKI